MKNVRIMFVLVALIAIGCPQEKDEGISEDSQIRDSFWYETCDPEIDCLNLNESFSCEWGEITIPWRQTCDPEVMERIEEIVRLTPCQIYLNEFMTCNTQQANFYRNKSFSLGGHEFIMSQHISFDPNHWGLQNARSRVTASSEPREDTYCSLDIEVNSVSKHCFIDPDRKTCENMGCDFPLGTYECEWGELIDFSEDCTRERIDRILEEYPCQIKAENCLNCIKLYRGNGHSDRITVDDMAIEVYKGFDINSDLEMTNTSAQFYFHYVDPFGEGHNCLFRTEFEGVIEP